jgi:protein O-mannosyl-transferase
MAKAASKSRPRTTAVVTAPEPPARNWMWIIWPGIALVAALAVFAPALKGTFVFDDFTLPFANPQAAQMPARFWIGGVRPVLMATYWMNFLMSGASPFGYHLFNVLLHVATSAIVFFIYDRLFAIAHPTVPAAADRQWFAFFGAALFLLHPLQTESVDYIAGRSELVSGFFFFAAWLVFLRHFEKDSTFVLTLKIAVLSGLAVLGKESAISLPGLLVLTDLYFSERPIVKQLLSRLKLYSVFLLGGAAAVILILRSLTRGTAAGFQSGVNPLDYALTQCRVILTYIRLFFLPFGQNGDWQLPFYHSFTDGAAAVYPIVLLAALAATFWLYKRDRLISFGLAAFFLMLAPTSSIVPVADAIAERRMYLPIAGLIFAVLGAVARMRLTPAMRWAGAIATVLILSVLSYNRSVAWASDLSLWTDSVQTNPTGFRAHYGLGAAMLARGDCAHAVEQFSTARSLPGPTQGVSRNELLWNLAEAYRCSKQPTEALAAYQSFAAAKPTAAAYRQIGFVQASLGNSDAALTAFGEALALDPNDAATYTYRGLARIALKDLDGAESDLHRALDLDPGNQVAVQGLATVASQR